MSKVGYRAGPPLLQYPVSTTSAIGTMTAVVPTCTALDPTVAGNLIQLNSVESALPAGDYNLVLGPIGEDPTAGGYSVGCCTAALESAVTVGAGEGIQVQIAAEDRTANMAGCPALAAYLLEPGNTNYTYAGMFTCPPSGEINFSLTTLPLPSAPSFPVATLHSTDSDSQNLLGVDRAPTAYTFVTLGPTATGTDVGRPVSTINFTPDVSADIRIPTVRSTLVGFEILPNQMQEIVLAAGGDFTQMINSGSNLVQQARLSPSVVTAIFPGNRPFRLFMPLNSDGSQEMRTYMAKIIRNIDEITERWKKTEQTAIQFRLADLINDYLLMGIATELHFVTTNTAS